MPQLVVLAAIGAGLYAGYKALMRAGARMADDLKRSEDEVRARASAGADASEKDLGSLEYDPMSGVYKPVRKV